MPAKGKGKAYRWLLANQSYPHKEWCLIWPFFRDKNGRGWLTHNGETGYAHRFMCRLAKGDPPTTEHGAAHSCGNGDGGCINPWHLSWKTQADNLKDCAIHGTQPKHHLGSRGHFTPDQVAQIKELLQSNTQLSIARMFGVTESTISDIARGKHYSRPSKIKFWTPEEDDKIRDCVRRGLNFPQMANEIGKPVKSVMSRAYRIGLSSGVPVPQPRTFQ